MFPLFCLAAGALAVPLAASAAESPGAFFTFDGYRPTLTSPDGRFSLSGRARLQLDTASFDQAGEVDLESAHLDPGALVRRAYLGVEGRAFRDLWYEVRMDFGGDGFRIADPYFHLARLSYNWIGRDAGPLIRVNAGLIKPIFTYYDATSSAALTFLERAAVVNVATTAFGGGAPRLGAELTFQDEDVLRAGDNLVVSAAYTGHIASNRTSDIPRDSSAGGTHALGRVVYRLWSDGLSNIQVGSSASRILTVGGSVGPGGAHTLTLEDRPEVRVDGNSLVSTAPLPATGGVAWGLETAANWRDLYVAAEYYDFTVERDTACAGCIAAPDPAFSGWYVEASWIVTGEAKTYQAFATNNGLATYGNPRVAAPFARDGQSWGAWEIAGRYSDLDLNWHAGSAGSVCAQPGCVRGGRQKIWSLGLNWYLSDSLRLLFDYMLVDVDKLNSAGVQVGQTFSVIGTRFQFTN